MRVKVKLISEAGTGYYYTTTKNPKNSTEKLRFKKYDPYAPKGIAEDGDSNKGGKIRNSGKGGPDKGAHVWFKEGKIK